MPSRLHESKIVIQIYIIRMEKNMLFLPLILGIFLILFLASFSICKIYNCISLKFNGVYDSVIFDENILWNSIFRIIPRSTRNSTNCNTITDPAEIICNQPNISPDETDQQNQYQRRKSIWCKTFWITVKKWRSAEKVLIIGNRN